MDIEEQRPVVAIDVTRTLDPGPEPCPEAQAPAQPDQGSHHSIARRTFLSLGLTPLALAGWGITHRLRNPLEERIPLYSAGVAFSSAGQRVMLGPEDPFPTAGSRVLTGAEGVTDVLAAEATLLAAALARSDPRWADLSTSAVLDLNVLTHALPAPVAAWTDRWHYVWPRDAAHVCRTLAALGRHEEVRACLRFLVRAQRADGHFEARYTLTGGVPDARPMQADGVGWFLWAVRECCAALPAHRTQLLALTRDAANHALTAIYADLESGDGLPSATPDYWEVPESRTTLGIAALTLAGLQSAAELGPELCEAAVYAGGYADRLRERIRVEFGHLGYQRYVRGGGHDAAITFLLPPYVTGFEQEVGDLLLDVAWQDMLRPAGGVAPGARWKDDFISWTPETALFAQAYAALGNRERAEEILGWLETHRTEAGSLPEKVLSDGEPAAVAPLAWTCAVVCSTVFTLAQTQAG